MELKQKISAVKFTALTETADLKVEKPSIVSRLIEALGTAEAGVFTLSLPEFGGVRRSLSRAAREKKQAKLSMKLLKVTGSGAKRTYEVAISRVT